MAPRDLALPPGAAPQPRPVAGMFVAGYGAYVNAALIAKVEPARRGKDWHVIAYLTTADDENTKNTSVQRSQAMLTPPLETEREAQVACDRICSTLFLAWTLREDGVGGAFWPGDTMTVDVDSPDEA